MIAVGRHHTARYIIDEDSIEIPVRRVILHEKYIKWRHKDDIALLELERNIPVKTIFFIVAVLLLFHRFYTPRIT